MSAGQVMDESSATRDAGRLSLLAPLDGWTMAIGTVPDPVFSGELLGGGIGIDPTGAVLCAPCAGTVQTLHRAHHALTLAGPGGVSVLMHIGLDTVALNGAGFTPLVAEGQQVEAGTPLIRFDLDLLARRARCMISPIVIAGDGWRIRSAVTDRLVRQGEPVLEIEAVAPGEAAPPPAAASQPPPSPQAGEALPQAEREVEVIDPVGLHARPAGLIANCANGFDAISILVLNGRTASTRSPVAMLSLGVQQGDRVTVRATGPQAAQAVAGIAALLSRPGLGNPGLGSPGPAPQAAPAAVAPPAAAEDGVLRGVTAAPGLAVGRARRLELAEIAVEEAGQGVEAERQRLAAGLAAAQQDLRTAIEGGGSATPEGQILAAHLAFAQDPELAATADELIGQGKSAAFAWRTAIDERAAQLQGLGNARLAERVDDLRDVGRRVLLVLSGRGEAPRRELPPGSILLADDLLPSQLSGLDLSRIVGLCTSGGGPTSHVAILAASHDIPALVAVGPALGEVADGTELLLDASAGTCRLNPPADMVAEATARLKARREAMAGLQEASRDAGRLADGTAVEIVANLGGVDDVAEALAKGAEGCGLLRSEFMFLGRDTAPGEDEQLAAYQAIADALGERRLIIRTLDPAADKVLPYLGLPPEQNPSLGMRGVRTGLWKPDLLRTQLRAILRVRPAGRCLIMLPMIATLDELRQVRAMLDREKAALGMVADVKLGIMIEVPSAALLADQLAVEADFFSIGTNDLTQYVLAMDRGNPTLAAPVDALHPAVLRLIARTAEGAHAAGRWTGVCGSLASDPLAAPLLVGLGVTELSATAAAIPRIKALLARQTLALCQQVAREALRQPSAGAVRALIARHWSAA